MKIAVCQAQNFEAVIGKPKTKWRVRKVVVRAVFYEWNGAIVDGQVGRVLVVGDWAVMKFGCSLVVPNIKGDECQCSTKFVVFGDGTVEIGKSYQNGEE